VSAAPGSTQRAPSAVLASPGEDEPRRWRLSLLRNLVWLGVGVEALAGLAWYWTIPGSGGFLLVAVAISTTTVALAAITRLPYPLRAGLFLAGFGLTVMTGMARQGFAPNSGAALVGLAIMTTVLLGWRWGGVSIALAAASMVAVGLAHRHGLLFRMPDWAWAAESTRAETLVRVPLIFLLMATLAALTVGYVLTRAEELLRQKTAALEALERERREGARVEAWYREIFEGTRDAVFVHDVITGRILDANRVVERMYGLSREEILASRPSEMSDGKPPYSDAEALAWLRRAIEEGPQLFEWRARRKDGERFWVEVALSSTTIGGEGRVLATVRDVTERHRLEQQFQQSQRLESLGRLAGGVAHDFNNLLTVILGSAELIKGALADRQPVDPDDAEQILGAGGRARDVTRQLLAFARRQVVAPVALDLNAVVRSAERLLRRLLGEGIDLRVSLQEELWAVRCDPGQVEQVIMNLSVNARDAMPRGGVLTLETRNVVRLDDPSTPAGTAEWVQLVVRDSGLGMSPDVKMHLFEPFFTTKPPGQGTGLGLATVHGILALSGGRVSVDSEPGHGTRFELSWPRWWQPAAPEAAPVSPESLRGTETILVVEDDPQVREIVGRALRGGGYRTLVADGAATALELLGRLGEAPHLVITDVVMKGLHGRDLADALHARDGALPVLFISGYPQDILGSHGVVDAGLQFLSKPFTTEALLARVRALLDRA
jgi:two-component system, cell cycle sensor histidine kinase and response regulator CckA